MQLHDLIEELSDPQQQAAIRSFKRCVVTAGPGSGKTYRLVLKLAYLLGQEVQAPQAIACITYMNDAVREIEDRVSNLGFDGDERLFIGTVHRFCITAILLPFYDVFVIGFPKKLSIVDEDAQHNYISQALITFGISDKLDIPDKIIKFWKQKINKYRIDLALAKTPSSQEVLREVAEAYKALLRENQQVDLEDIALEAYRLITTEPQVRAFVRAHYPWLVVDEYQDLGQIFNELIMALIQKTDINLFIVGDANQSIMGFQGAEPSYLRNLGKMPGVKQISIQITRRCLPHIVELANKLISDHDSKILTLQAKDGTRAVKYKECLGGLDQQITCIVEEIQHLQNIGTPLGEIAVLCRTKDVVKQFSDAFIDAGINYSGDKDERYPRTPLTRWLEDLAMWQTEGWEIGNPKFEKIYRDYNRFIKLSNYTALELRTSLDRKTHFFMTLWKSKQKGLLVSDWLTSLAQELNLDLIVEGLTNFEPYDVKAFWEFSERTQPHQKLGHMTIADLALCGRSAKSVFLSTLHSSKGLEFDTVIIPDLEQGRLPDYRAETTSEIDEERRLLFVGITRAKRDVFLLWSNFYTLPWGKRSTDGRSQFLDEMGIP